MNSLLSCTSYVQGIEILYRFENYMAFFFPPQLKTHASVPKREDSGRGAQSNRSGAGSGASVLCGHPGQGLGWLNSSE